MAIIISHVRIWQWFWQSYCCPCSTHGKITSSSHIMTHPDSLRNVTHKMCVKHAKFPMCFPEFFPIPTWIRDGDSTTQWHHDWEKHGPPPVQRSPPNNKCLAVAKNTWYRRNWQGRNWNDSLVVPWSVCHSNWYCFLIFDNKMTCFIQEMEDANFNWTTIFKYILNICHKTNKSLSLSQHKSTTMKESDSSVDSMRSRPCGCGSSMAKSTSSQVFGGQPRGLLKDFGNLFSKKTFNCLTQGVWFCLIDSFLSFFQNHQIPFADRFSGMLMLTWQANNAKLHPRPGVAARDCPNHEGPAYLKESWRSDSDRSMTLVILHLHLGSVDDAFLLIYVCLILSNHLLYAVISVIKRCLYLLVVLV